jgi:hypothetical protein
MTEFPALRQALVAAAARRRRRRLLAGTAVPAFAACAAAAVFVALPHPAPEREIVARPPKDALEQAFKVFRRAQRAADVMPSGKVVPGTVDRARTRFLKQGGPVRYFAAPTTVQGVPTLCLVAVRRKVPAAAGCGPVSDAVKEAKPARITVGNVTGVFLPDGSSDLRFIYANGVGGVSPRNGLSLVLSPGGQVAGTSWTGASGTRYVRYTGAVPKAGRMPVGCPKKLEPLPADGLAKARRAALIAVDRFYPQASEATVTAAARPTGTPCSDAVTDRSIEVSLKLVPPDPKQRKSASLSQGRVLAGMRDGYMRIFYLLH